LAIPSTLKKQASLQQQQHGQLELKQQQLQACDRQGTQLLPTACSTACSFAQLQQQVVLTLLSCKARATLATAQRAGLTRAAAVVIVGAF
jgi:hypothetical protein